MTTRKKVLVTGGAQGIGREITDALAKQGYEVHVTFRKSRQSAEKICLEYPGQIFAHQLDQGRTDSIRSATFLDIEDWWGVVFNAGVGSATARFYTSHSHPSPEAVDEAMMLINALGPLALYQTLRRKLEARKKAKLIFISSVGGGVTTFPGFLYSDGMSKAALSQLARQIAIENTHTGIDVFTLCPGATETAMFEASTLSNLSAGERDELISQLPKGRLIHPKEIAHWVTLLMQPESTILHGCSIDASAGLGVRPDALFNAQRA